MHRPGDFCLDNAFALIEGHPPGTSCGDFGACGSPIGSDFGPGIVLAGGGTIEIGVCAAQPQVCGGILIGTYIVVRYGPQIIHALASAIDPYNHYLKDLKACAERYVPGPERDKCYEQAAR
jgi:hypothetical protein